MRKSSYTAILKKEGKLYVALCSEPDVASQGKMVEEARSRLCHMVLALITLWLDGCAGNVVIEPVKSAGVHESLRSVPIALLDVIVVPATVQPDEERLVLSFPDEIAVRRGGTLVLVPSPVIVPVTEILFLTLGHLGLNVQRAPSLAAAHKGGARLAILCVLRRGAATFGADVLRLELPRTVEAVAEADVAVVDLTSGRTVWSGPLRSTARYDNLVTFDSFDFAIESGAFTAAGEGKAQAARAVLTRAYFSLAAELAGVLEKLGGAPQ